MSCSRKDDHAALARASTSTRSFGRLRKLAAIATFLLAIVTAACSDLDPIGDPPDASNDSWAGGETASDDTPTVNESVSVSPKRFADLDTATLDDAIAIFLAERPELPGLGFGIVGQDQGVLYRRGYGDFEIDSRIFLTSAGKVFSTSLLLGMVSHDGFDIDRPLAQYLDWGEHKSGLTMRHVLSMTAGLPGLTDEWPAHACMFDAHDDLSRCGRHIFQADDRSVSATPGLVYRYGGGSWQLAGAVLERVTAMDWSEAFRTRIADPCQLSETSFVNFFDLERGFVMPYPRHLESLEPEGLATDNPSIEAGVLTTLDDYAALLRMHLQGGRCGDTQVLSSAMVHESRVLHVVERPGMLRGSLGYAMGWWAFHVAPGAVRVNSSGYGSVSWIDPELGYGVVVLARGEGNLATEFLHALYPTVHAVMSDAAL